DARLRRNAAGKPGHPREPVALAEALADLAFEGLAVQEERLVVDAAALEDAGLSPGTPFRVGEGEEPALASLKPLDLVYVPCRPASLVTTRRQWQAWQQAARGTASDPAEEDPEAEDLVPEPVTLAVATALADGHDLSGRFRT